MRFADVHVGQAVAVSANLKGKHINMPELPAADRGVWLGRYDLRPLAWERLQERRLSGDAFWRMGLDGLPATLAREMNKHPNAERGLRFHRGVVREVGLPWGGRRVGVVVDVEVPRDDRGRWERSWAYEITEVAPLADTVSVTVPGVVSTTVPAVMLTDYDAAVLEATRQVMSAQAYMAARRAGRDVGGFEAWLRAGRLS
jgi:hypothetical protein